MIISFWDKQRLRDQKIGNALRTIDTWYEQIFRK